MLGSDLYRLEGIITVYGSELKALALLYRELIGDQGVAFYLNLIFQDKVDFQPLNGLLHNLNLSLDQFEDNLHRLEEFGLVLTYNQSERYIIVLNKPLAYHDFIEHDIFGRLLIKKVDHSYYEFLKRGQISSQSDKTGFKNVSKTIDYRLLDTWSSDLEIKYNELRPRHNDKSDFDSSFDIRGFMRSIKNASFPQSLRTYDNLNKIAMAADTYALNKNDLRKFVIRSTDYEPVAFHYDRFLSLCRNANIEHCQGTGYQMPCVAFLQNLQDGKEPTYNDKLLIERLRLEYKLHGEVINYLLEYAYFRCDHQLIPSFIYTVASNLKRNDIATAEKAKTFLTAYGKNKKTANKPSSLPDYDEIDNSDIQISDEEYEQYFKEYDQRGER